MNRPPSHIKLVYWNCASLAQRLKDGSIHALLNPDFTPDPPTILALVETRWVDQDPSLHKRRAHAARLPYVPNYTWAHRHHTSKSGGSECTRTSNGRRHRRSARHTGGPRCC